jgi:hypothetical protein
MQDALDTPQPYIPVEDAEVPESQHSTVRLAGEVVATARSLRRREGMDRCLYILRMRIQPRQPLHSIAEFVPPQETPRVCAPRYTPEKRYLR